MNDVTERDDMQKFLNEQKPPFSVYIAANTEDQFYKDVDARWETALPMTMIFDRDGKNVYFYKEARTYDQFEKDITRCWQLPPRNNASANVSGQSTQSFDERRTPVRRDVFWDPCRACRSPAASARNPIGPTPDTILARNASRR